MKETPIICSSESIKKILSGEKTQTRRVIKPQPNLSEWRFNGTSWEKFLGYPHGHDTPISPYGTIGDFLWIRETFATTKKQDCVVYKADYSDNLSNEEQGIDWKWKSPRFMPRIASRITLEIVNLRVERLQEISEADAKAEGIELSDDLTGCADDLGGSYKKAFVILWNEINAKRGFAFESNPFVFVIEFKDVSRSATDDGGRK